jgi:integrase
MSQTEQAPLNDFETNLWVAADELNSAWKRARILAGLPQLRVHDLRHTFSHRLRPAEVRLEDRKALIGDTNGDITTNYSAADVQQLQEFVERIVD